MADYTAYFRSNYFAVKGAAQFQQFCDDFHLTLIEDGDAQHLLYGFMQAETGGGIPSTKYNPATDEWDELDFMALLAAQLANDHVAVVMEIGWEKLRYFVGVAYAVNAAGESIKVDIDEIYARAASLGRQPTSCTY